MPQHDVKQAQPPARGSALAWHERRTRIGEQLLAKALEVAIDERKHTCRVTAQKTNNQRQSSVAL